MANKTLRGSAVYAKVQLLTEQFSRGTGSSSTGTVPWEYESLPGFIADAWTALITGGPILHLARVDPLGLLPRGPRTLGGHPAPEARRRDRDILEVALEGGLELTARQLSRLMKLLDDTDSTA
ncbi:MAG: hypothetical protein F2840_01050 [Actinobacteria bacterium]|nr:hypothetical protein [Actinomycetota bacterium]